MLDFEFSLPTKVFFGRNAQERIPGILKKEQVQKVLLHSYDEEQVKNIPVYQEIKRLLKENEIAFVELLGVQPNPTLDFVGEGITLCRKEGVDFILAVGGGSVIDSAKGIALGVHTSVEDVWSYVEGNKTPDPARTLKTGAVLTAAAAGSETSTAAVIMNTKLNIKRGAHHEVNRPFFTVMNPEITFSVPAFQTACGVFDSIMHVCERYFTSSEDAALTDRMAEAVMKSIIEAGHTVMKEPQDYEARATLMWGASIAHNNLLGCGRLKGCGLHLIEEEMHSANARIVHGAGLSVLFPAWARQVCKKAPGRFAQFAVRVWNVEMNFEHPEETAEKGIALMEHFIEELGLPRHMEEIGVSEADFGQIARQCIEKSQEVSRLCHLTEEEVRNILYQAL